MHERDRLTVAATSDRAGRRTSRPRIPGYARGVLFDVDGLVGLISALLWVGQLGLKAFALFDATRRSSQAFPTADKQSKKFWLIVLGLALAANLILPGGLGLLTILGTIAAMVYVVDARPALVDAEGRGGRSNGPYGPW